MSVTDQPARLRAVEPADEPDDRALAEVSVVIADDHTLMLRSLRTVLEQEPGVVVVGEADNLALAERHVEGHRPDVLVLDLSMNGDSSLATLARLRVTVPRTHVVVVSVEDSPGFAQRALNSGAEGFVVKDHADEDLVAAVRAAARGDEFLSKPIAARVAELRHALARGDLSLRETEVLRLIALGHTSVEIAAKLSLSPRTVETHRARIHRKLELRTRAELVRYALRLGLLSI